MDFDLVVAICIIWKLPDIASSMLLKRTFNEIQKFDRRHLAVQAVLNAYWDGGFDKANEYLKAWNVAELAYPKA